MELRHRERVIQLKIVYYGPAVGGKTTNLQMLHAAARGEHRGEFVSVNSAQDRTILFDLLPLKGVGFHGFEIRFQLLAVPGQAIYAPTRRLVLKGVDALVFVANSAFDRLGDNMASLKELEEYLAGYGVEFASIPIVFQYNKRDLPQILPFEALERNLNLRSAPSFSGIAVHGVGVLETLGAIIERVMVQLTARYPSLALGPGHTIEAWTWESLSRVFGRTSLSAADMPPEADEHAAGAEPPAGSASSSPGAEEDRDALDEAPPRRIVQVPLGLEAGPAERRAGGDSTEGMLADSYARASVSLGESLDELRGELDQARRRLRDLAFVLRKVEALEAGRPTEGVLRAVLRRMISGGLGRRGILIAPREDRSLRQLAAVGVRDDPFVAAPDGARLAEHHFVPLEAPKLFELGSWDDLAAAARGLDPPVKAIAAVPIRAGHAVHAVVLLYYGDTDPQPSEGTLAHLALMARGLAAWFYVNRARRDLEDARRHPKETPQGEAALHALVEIEGLVAAAGDLLHGASSRPLVAPGALEQAASVLQGAAIIARTITSLGKHEAAPKKRRS